jgi:hypothetical protein
MRAVGIAYHLTLIDPNSQRILTRLFVFFFEIPSTIPSSLDGYYGEDGEVMKVNGHDHIPSQDTGNRERKRDETR